MQLSLPPNFPSATTPYSSPSMADRKVTKMVMKVDLQCSKCYRKIKEVLCRYPQIRDQAYDKKQNTVTITVVCCSPENIKKKIACKAGDTVESIEIIPDKPSKIVVKPLAQIPDEPPQKVVKPPATALPMPVVQGFPYPVCVCCCCYGGWPCYHGRGPMCYDGCGRPAYECSAGNRGYYVCRCEEHFSEDNAWGCSVM